MKKESLIDRVARAVHAWEHPGAVEDDHYAFDNWKHRYTELAKAAIQAMGDALVLTDRGAVTENSVSAPSPANLQRGEISDVECQKSFNDLCRDTGMDSTCYNAWWGFRNAWNIANEARRKE